MTTVAWGLLDMSMLPFEPRTMGLAIERLRVQRLWSQEELAARAGGPLRQSDISRIERGEVRARRDRLERIAAAFDMNLKELLAESSREFKQRGWVRDPPPGPMSEISEARKAMLVQLLQSVRLTEDRAAGIEGTIRSWLEMDKRTEDQMS
ncbi:MAG: helix-turn-helix domain-containing protein [Chloroflexota bacterium]|nr:helix-turn-helix domain-containing protein [Chloroflexota bacterium]